LRVLLTGATGLLGSHILKQGLERGVEFICLGRNISKRSFLAICENRVQFISTDLTNQDAINKAAEQITTNIDLVIHAAALASPFQKDEEMMEKLNIEGTKFLYKIFGQSASWVQISSVAAMSDGGSQVIDENSFGSCRETFYANTKLKIDGWLEQQRDDILFIHPCYMLGDWDARPSSGSVFLALKFKKFPYYLQGQKNFVAAQDVAKGIWQAIDKQVSGRYLLGHVNIDLQSFFTLACEKLKITDLPKPVQVEQLESVCGTEESLRFLQEFCQSNAVDYQKAQREFGYSPLIGLDEMIDKTLSYFQEKKLLRVR